MMIVNGTLVVDNPIAIDVLIDKKGLCNDAERQTALRRGT